MALSFASSCDWCVTAYLICEAGITERCISFFRRPKRLFVFFGAAVAVGAAVGAGAGDGAMVACGLGYGVVCAAPLVPSAITRPAVASENNSFFINLTPSSSVCEIFSGSLYPLVGPLPRQPCSRRRALGRR